ncbi:MAG: TonB-dependent receptor [Rhodothermaceae bacterium]|nr:TonB-dependent receptor [Rhodothermaceae bacterium]MYG68926.1 TonB-dependent receptor [Rhodothermaceae bacterium]MYJ45768.1 TonB-dependent receptor [Rhodothermaceae bacterium]
MRANCVVSNVLLQSFAYRSEQRMRATKWLSFGLLLGWLWSPVLGTVTAQSLIINGYVEDMASRERILGASVYIPALQIGTTTNQYGFYSLTTVPGSHLISVSHVGYDPVWIRLELAGDTTLTLTLAPRVVGLDDMEVFADQETNLNDVQMSRHEISIEEIETLPVILGEIDIQKTLQLLPGVQSGLEGSSGLYVRGGRADQNLILLDGLPLYNPNHLFGFFSVFNSAAMKRVELIKGGFPARYGGRLSSVISYTMKEGNLKCFAGQGAIGLLSSRAMLEGPIVKDRASFLVAGRRTYIDQLLRPFQRGRTRYGAAFYDLNFKANYVISKRDRIYLSAYAGQDEFSYKKRSAPVGLSSNDELDYELGWSNRLASLRWNRLIRNRLFANVLVGVMKYRFSSGRYSLDESDGVVIKYEGSWHSEVVDWTAKIDFEFIPNSRHYMRFGAEGILHRFDPGTTQTRLEESGRPPVNLLQAPTGGIGSQEMALYVEDEIQLHRDLRATTGIRFSSYTARGVRYNSFEPRLGANVRVAEKSVIKISYARSKQYVHLLTGGGTALPTDLWIPSMDRITPQSGHQLAVGLINGFRDGRYEVSIEGYLKYMTGHLEYKLGADRFRSAFLDWPDIVEIGTGTALGAEIFIQKKGGRLTGWAGYTWSRTTRRFESLNGGDPFPDGYDRRHDVSIVTQYQFSTTRQISAVWVYGSGYPVWVPIGRFFTDSNYLLDIGPVNSARAPAYHRLDISANFTKLRSWGERTISLGLYNAYNRKNPMFIYPHNDASCESTLCFRQMSLLQLIPAISWKWKF